MWEAAIARRNVAALAFWRRAIGEHPLSQQIEEIDVSRPDWNGPVLRFRIRAA
jgi:predicted acetyltransferase